ncbi:MAG: hypothetical protein VYA30_01940 [Myxococcota bacterium]|nr:hypothetical protein [Myxococcota bacterium]
MIVPSARPVEACQYRSDVTTVCSGLMHDDNPENETLEIQRLSQGDGFTDDCPGSCNIAGQSKLLSLA